jgi:hypothetical protein
VAGESGRWKRNLIAKCVRAGKPYDDNSVSPVVRQLLTHWAYELTEEHFDEYAALVRKGKTTSFVPQYSMEHVVEKDGRNRASSSKRDAGGRAERASKRSRT